MTIHSCLHHMQLLRQLMLPAGQLEPNQEESFVSLGIVTHAEAAHIMSLIVSFIRLLTLKHEALILSISTERVSQGARLLIAECIMVAAQVHCNHRVVQPSAAWCTMEQPVCHASLAQHTDPANLYSSRLLWYLIWYLILTKHSILVVAVNRAHGRIRIKFLIAHRGFPGVG